MSTVARRIRSIPERSASATWELIVELIAPDAGSAARQELSAAAGIACACITDEALVADALVVYGVGPRLRIYALYGDAAVEGDDALETTLSYVPTDGDWRMSIPCLPDDLIWVRRGLAEVSKRVGAHVVGESVAEESDDVNARSGFRIAAASSATLDVDRDAFFRR